MRRTLLSVLLAGAGLVALASPAGAGPSPNACNRGTMHAHHTVPHGNPAHAHIPSCGGH